MKKFEWTWEKTGRSERRLSSKYVICNSIWVSNYFLFSVYFVQMADLSPCIKYIFSYQEYDSPYAFRVFYDLDNCKNNDALASGIAKISNDPSLNVYSGGCKMPWLQLFAQARL